MKLTIRFTIFLVLLAMVYMLYTYMYTHNSLLDKKNNPSRKKNNNNLKNNNVNNNNIVKTDIVNELIDIDSIDQILTENVSQISIGSIDDIGSNNIESDDVNVIFEDFSSKDSKQSNYYVR